MYEGCCSKCVYSIFDMNHICAVPSIYICYNRKSNNYEHQVAWLDSCDKFMSEAERAALIRIEQEKCGWVTDGSFGLNIQNEK